MMLDFMKYATMAPSTRNTRPWLLHFTEQRIRILPDLTRWLPFDDPDQKQLYMSLGCVLENLTITAAALQYDTELEFNLEGETPEIALHLTRSPKLEKQPLFDMLDKRSTHRGHFGKQPVPKEPFEALRKVGGEVLFLSTDPEIARQMEDLNIQAEVELYSNVSFCQEAAKYELATWLHSNIWAPKLHLLACLALGKDPSWARITAPLVGLLFIRSFKRKDLVMTGSLLQRLFLTATLHHLKFRPISNCLREEKGRKILQSLSARPSSLPAVGFYCGYALT